MSPRLVAFLQSWLITTVAMLVATHIVTGCHYDTATDLLIATLLLGILNAFVRPFLLFLSLPLLLFSLGLFTLVINALLLYTVGHLVKGFHVESFWVACKAALVMALISLVLNSLTGTGHARLHFTRTRRPPDEPPRPGGGGGPIIDV